MPLYDYKCTECGLEQAHIVKLLDFGKTIYCESETCGAPLEKMVTKMTSVFHFGGIAFSSSSSKK